MWVSSMLTSAALGALALGFIGLSVPVQAEEPLQGRALIETLQQGGNVVYFRHSTTDHISSDQDPVDYTDPTTQRNLSEEGRKSAFALGQAWRELGIQVSKVVASPFCRAIETGWLAFGQGELSDDLAFAIGTDETEARRLGKALKDMMVIPPPPGTNTILISHSANLKEAVGVWPKEEGIVVVFKPLPNGEIKPLGEILITEWPKLAAQYGQPKDKKSTTASVNEPTPPSAERSVLCGELTSRPAAIRQQAKR